MGSLRRYLPSNHPALSTGPVRLEDESKVGEHDGYAHFTVGQRKGLPGGFSEPMFVIAIRPSDKTIIIGPRESLSKSNLTARGVNWLCDPPQSGESIGVRIRHGAAIVEADVRTADQKSFELQTRLPQTAITPGQSAELYREDVVVGGGVIISN